MTRMSNLETDVHGGHCGANYENVPTGYTGMRLPTRSMKFLHLMSGSLWLYTIGEKIVGDRDAGGYRDFMDAFNDTMEEIVRKRMELDNGKMRIVWLDMDYFSIDGKFIVNIDERIMRLGQLKKQYGDKFLFFISVDPNRHPEEIRELLNLGLVCGASGFKMYPSLGYLPTHPNLMDIIYPFCVKHNWPITTHCSSALTHASAKKILIKGYDADGNYFERLTKFKKKEDYRELNNPAHYEYVFKKYKSIVINFAHYGGEEIGKNWLLPNSWCNTIMRYMRENGAYSDCSFSYANYDYLSKIISTMVDYPYFRKGMLFGSDLPLVSIEGRYKEKYNTAKAAFGYLWQDAAIDNPDNFLNNVKSNAT